jgi:hypothetical protein
LFSFLSKENNKKVNSAFFACPGIALATTGGSAVKIVQNKTLLGSS